MIKPLWAIAGASLLGTAGVAGVLVVTSSGGEEEIVQQVGTATPSETPASTATISATGSPQVTTTPVPSASPVSTLTYTDPTYGYSFEYPADWFLDASPDPPGAQGGGPTVATWDVIHGPSPGANLSMKVDFSTISNPENLTTDQWVARRRVAEGDTLISTEVSSLGGERAVRQEWMLEVHGMRLTSIAVANGQFMYEIHAFWPPESKLVSRLDEILASFRFEQ